MNRHLPRLLLMSALLSGTPPAAAHEADFRDLAGSHLPWSLLTVYESHPAPHDRAQLAPGFADIDGDGAPELVIAEPTKIMAFEFDGAAIKPRWQHNMPPGWRHNPGALRLGASVDIDGDGIREIPYTVEREDHGAWRYRVFAPGRDSVVVDAPLPVFAGPRREPWWDGFYHVAGVLDDPDGSGRPAVLLVREVMYDAFPRGLVAVDAASGAVVWEWLCGPNPTLGMTTVTDLDRDGRQEIVLYGGAPGNLGGRLVNGTSDNLTRLFVVSARGETVVDRVLGPERFSGGLQVADLDGDGRSEIVTFSQNGNPGVSNVLAVWDGPTGAIRAQCREVAAFKGLAVLPGPRAGTSRLLTGSDDGTVRRLLYDGVTLVEDGRLLTDENVCNVIGALDLVSDPGPEVLVDVGAGGTLAVLDRDLRTLATTRGSLDSPVVTAGTWNRGADDRTLVALGSGEWHIFRPARRSLWQRYGDSAGRPALGAATLLLAFGGGLALGRRRRGAARRPLAGHPDRHRLRAVLQELQETDHGTLGATKGLRRIVMLACGPDGLQDPALRQRFRQVGAELQESVLDRLRGILATATQASFAPATTAASAAALERFTGHLQTLLAGAEADGPRLADLRRDQELVEAGFAQLRREVSAYFTTDPARMLQGMLLVREVDLGRQGILTTLDAPAAAPCLIDSADLRFVLDNLLDNAVRALAGVAHRDLRLAVVDRGGEVLVTVTDSGPGVPEALRTRIFSGRQSTRQGGGLGLARSRRILARWGGEIALAEPQPDRGASFTVSLQALAV